MISILKINYPLKKLSLFYKPKKSKILSYPNLIYLQKNKNKNTSSGWQTKLLYNLLHNLDKLSGIISIIPNIKDGSASYLVGHYP
jgi:hypothetical protein